MSELWVVGEPGLDGGLARLSTEAATLARDLGDSSGHDVVGIVIAADPSAAAKELARFVPRVVAVADPAIADHSWSVPAAARLADLLDAATPPPDLILVGAGPDGRDLAGALSALTGLGVLTNATGVAWTDAGATVEMSAFGGKLVTTSGFTAGRGIVTVRPNVVTAVPADAPGTLDRATAAPSSRGLPGFAKPNLLQPLAR